MGKTLTSRTLVWAHRGSDAYQPENTMPSFELAIEHKADGIELDVHFSKDGKIIVLHDEKIDRTSNGQGFVTDYTLEELKHFDFGCKFLKEYKGIHVPTLDEVYDLYSKTDMTINVEIKTADLEMPAALFALAKKYDMVDKIIYSSFNHLQLAKMREVYPDAFVAPLYGFNMLNAWDYCELMGANASHPRSNQVQLFEGYVDKCHAKGIRVHPWTVDTAEEAVYLADLGCDAIITNKPDVVLAALGR